MSGPSRRPASGQLPLLPLRSMTLLPGIGQPVELGRHASVDAIRMARERPKDDPRHRLIIVATQREELTERPDLEDLYPVGVLAEVTQALLGVGSRMTAIVRGIERVHILELDRTQSPTVVRYQRAHEPMGDPTLAYAMAGTLQDLVRQHDGLVPSTAQSKQRTQALAVINAERAPARIADLCATHVGLEPEKLAELLHELTVTERLRKVVEFVSPEHTARNLMIRAVRGAAVGEAGFVAEYREMKRFWGVTPYIERALGEAFRRIVNE